jgi:hypothetical protein
MHDLLGHAPIRPLRRVVPALLAALVFATGLLAVSGATDATASRAAGSKTLVYKAGRSALTISITRRGDRVIRASVFAPGLCEDGTRPPMGFALDGGTGFRIDVKGHFANSHAGFYFGGRFRGTKVTGTFWQTYRRNIEGEASEPLCGNIRPRGRAQHYVAKLFEVNGRRVHRNRGSGGDPGAAATG